MSQTPATPIDAMPTAPSLSDLPNFDTEADAFLPAMNTFGTQANALATVTYSNAQDAYSNAVIALAQAAAAAASAASSAASAGVVIWVSGSTYATGVCVFSPTNYITYRRKSASTGSSTTDPSADPTRWASLFLIPTWLRKTTTYTAASGDHIKASTAGGAWSLTFPPSPADGDQIEVQDVDGTFQTNNLTLLVNGNKIMGFTTSWVLDTQYEHLIFVYDSTLGDWRI